MLFAFLFVFHNPQCQSHSGRISVEKVSCVKIAIKYHCFSIKILQKRHTISPSLHTLFINLLKYDGSGFYYLQLSLQFSQNYGKNVTNVYVGNIKEGIILSILCARIIQIYPFNKYRRALFSVVLFERLQFASEKKLYITFL